jgi:cobyrinic acid a,c-diamide synthase
MVDVPRVVIAAPASGHGKTTLATGLLTALAQRGHKPAGFKVGPDYIDPGYHALATGRPGRNLDPVLVGEQLIAPLFAAGATGADIAIVEGVMGLYDGRAGAGDHGSTAQVATLLGAPVVLVVDASAQGRSVAALVQGFTMFGHGRPRIGGVVLNRVGSDRHEAILRDALDEVGVPVLGALRRQPAVEVPSRHLGLVPAAERTREALKAVEGQGAMVAAGVDLDAVVALARSAPPLDAEPWAPPFDEPAGPVVAVAGGAAFTFGYPENVELLRAAGAQVVTVDPLRDQSLPEGTSGLVVGGGFPEVYAEQLSGNARLRASVSALAASGAPVVAECAGLLWLANELDGHPMCGVIDAKAEMTPKLTLGYRDAVALSDSVLGPAGTRVTGHEFHRTAVRPGAGPAAAWQWSASAPSPLPGSSGTPRARRTRNGEPEGYVAGNLHASYLHLHWAGTPEFARRVVAACG